MPEYDKPGKDATPLAWALWYAAAMGWAVLPVHSIKNGTCTCRKKARCPSPGKHPRTRHGVKDATKDPKRIRGWWSKWPDANVGIATGKISSIVVVDVDPRNAGNDAVKQLESRLGKLPSGPRAKTGGGGQHLFFAYPGGKLRQHRVGGVDIKSDGGYIVAPPSFHSSGGCYRWQASPENIKLPELPQSWRNDLQGLSDLQGPSDLQGLEGITGDYRGLQDSLRGVSQDRLCDDQISIEKRVEEAIEKTLPRKPGDRHGCLFNFARALKFMPELQGRPATELQPYVRIWHKRALPAIVNCQAFEEEWWDFVDSWQHANHALEEGFMSIVQERAATAEPPAVAKQYENRKVRQLITFCREAQRLTGDQPFFLSSYDVAKTLDIKQRRAHRWLAGLVFDEVLELVEKGGRHKANVYRYLHPLEEDL